MELLHSSSALKETIWTLRQAEYGNGKCSLKQYQVRLGRNTIWWSLCGLCLLSVKAKGLTCNAIVYFLNRKVFLWFTEQLRILKSSINQEPSLWSLSLWTSCFGWQKDTRACIVKQVAVLLLTVCTAVSPYPLPDWRFSFYYFPCFLMLVTLSVILHALSSGSGLRHHLCTLEMRCNTPPALALRWFRKDIKLLRFDFRLKLLENY